MIRYFYKTISAHWCANPILYGLTVLGVALGVASVISIQILNQSAIASFAAGLRTLSAGADIIVTGKGSGLVGRDYAQVLGTPGVAAAWPVYETTVLVKGKPDTFLRVLGIDLLAPGNPAVRALSVGQTTKALTAALHEPGWVAMSPDLGRAMGWRMGDPFEVFSGSNLRQLRVGEFIDLRRFSPAASHRVLVMDIAQAQSLFGGLGRIQRVGVAAAAERSVAALVAELDQRLGGRAHVVTPEERTAEAKGLLAAFRLNLTALSLVSLLVGTFLVFSSMRACLVWQRKEFGVLRSLGSTPSQVLGLILGEALLLGTIGVVIGTPVGYWTAIWNLAAVSSTLTNVYMLQELETLDLSTGIVALAIFVGLGGVLSGTLLPALDLWRRDTRTLLESVSVRGSPRVWARNFFYLGVVLVVGAVGWYWLVGWHWQPSGFVLATTILLCLPLLTPFLVQTLTQGVPVPDFGFRYGVRSLGASLANTAFSVASLAMAVCLLVGITILVESFRDTLASWVNRSLRADIYITTFTAARRAAGSSVGAEVVRALARRGDVELVDALHRLYIRVGGRRVAVGGVDLSKVLRDPRFIFLADKEGPTIERAFRERGVLVGEPLARSAGVAVGDTLEIEGPRGRVRLPVSGVYYDYTEGGSITMDRGLLAEKFGPAPITSVALYLTPGSDTGAVVASIKDQFANGSLLVRSNLTLKDRVLDIFDQTFAVTRVLQIMSLIIAACAITLTLLVVAQEKSSEIALYQTLGARRRQIFWLFVNKGIAMACLGLVLGFVGGVGLGATLIFIVQKSYFGWSIQWTWPWGLLAAEALAILGATVLASLYPAIKASRTPATELCRADA